MLQKNFHLSSHFYLIQSWNLRRRFGSRKYLQSSYLRQTSFRCQTSATMKKTVGRKVCGFKIVGRINELDNRWWFRRWFRKQLSLGPFGVEFSTRIYRVYRSTAPSWRDFLLKSCISFTRFSGNPGAILRSAPTDLLWPLLKVLRPFSFASAALIVDRPLRERYVISRHPRHLSFFDSKWKSVLGIVLSAVIIAERAIHIER